MNNTRFAMSRNRREGYYHGIIWYYNEHFCKMIRKHIRVKFSKPQSLSEWTLNTH